MTELPKHLVILIKFSRLIQNIVSAVFRKRGYESPIDYEYCEACEKWLHYTAVQYGTDCDLCFECNEELKKGGER